MQLIAAASRILTAEAQIDAAQAIYDQAVDRNRSGVVARIDVNRSQVELQTQQQRLTSLTNDFEKQKLSLARLIGLPMSQTFTLADAIPYRETPTPPFDTVQGALARRPDVQAAQAQVSAAELAHRAAAAEMLPSVGVNADYGASGINPSQAHGTFTVAGAVQFPIFRSGRIRADIDQADAVLAQRKAELDDLKGRAEQEAPATRCWILATSAQQQIRVADSLNRSLAASTLELGARDRFRSGVADTIEVVQAQETVATAESDYITSLFAWNLARVSLARAMGQTEQGIIQILEGH